MSRSKAPNRSAAVMAQRAPATKQDEDALTALHRRLDYFPTPPWAARAGAELVQRIDPAARRVWEPACGEGHMCEGLVDYFEVLATDIHDHGGLWRPCVVADFLNPTEWAAPDGSDWIVTNPPYLLAEQFVRRGLEVARRGVAVLVRLSFLEGQERHQLLHGDHPVSVVAPFAERVSMTLGCWDPKAGLATAYAWFVWLKSPLREDFIAPTLIPIPPGTKARLTRPTDAQRLGKKTAAPLFDGAAE